MYTSMHLTFLTYLVESNGDVSPWNTEKTHLNKELAKASTAHEAWSTMKKAKFASFPATANFPAGSAIPLHSPRTVRVSFLGQTVSYTALTGFADAVNPMNFDIGCLLRADPVKKFDVPPGQDILTAKLPHTAPTTNTVEVLFTNVLAITPNFLGTAVQSWLTSLDMS